MEKHDTQKAFIGHDGGGGGDDSKIEMINSNNVLNVMEIITVYNIQIRPAVYSTTSLMVFLTMFYIAYSY